MPLYKGNKNISAIYKGTTPISAIYKGTKLVYSSAFWQSLFYSYLYHDLIPTTIDNKNVLDKAKVSKIYANGVVENQLCEDNFADGDTSYWARNRLSQVNTNNVATFTTNSNRYAFVSAYHSFSAGQLVKGHYYMYSIYFRITNGNCSRFEIDHHGTRVAYVDNPTLNQWYRLVGIVQQTRENTETTNGFDITRRYTSTSDVGVNSDTFEAKEPMLVDLTQAYPFDTPTTLTDNRIQALLNRGYIPHNTGEYKGTNISEFSSKDSNNVALDTISFIYQGDGAINSHDTKEITKDDVVFTKNVGPAINMGSLTWEKANTAGTTYPYRWRAYFTSYGASDYTKNNVVCEKYTTIDFSGATALMSGTQNKVCALSDNARLDIVDSDYDNYTAAQVATALDGKIFKVELATPQVITIPRKRLGIVDLGSLNWYYDSSNSRFYTADTLSNAKLPSTSSTLANVYCGLYKTGATGLGLNNLEIALHPNGLIYVKNTTYTSATDFKSAMASQYLFYETNAEVSDIADTISIEAGGTITSDSEVLPDVEFSVKCK